MMVVRRLGAMVMCGMLLAGCATGTSTPPPATPGGTASPSTAATPLGELNRLDRFVRTRHPNPFLIHPESEWTAKLAEIRPRLEVTTDPDERLVLMASLVGLLDTHSFIGPNSSFHEFPVFLYHFPDGWYVIAALDSTLVGARALSIDGHAIDEVEAALRPLVPHDNEMGFFLNAQQPLSAAEYLHGAGIVSDPTSATWTFKLHDGSDRTETFEPISDEVWGSSLNLNHTLVGDAPEAVRRNGELTWSKLDAKRRVMLIAVNDYGDETAVIDALKAALAAGQIDRLVLDIRYLPGGSGDFRVLAAIEAEPRINKPGALTVLIGRENFSIADAIVRDFDINSAALLVGEPTPALADNFRCDCVEDRLQLLGVTVSVPTWRDNVGDDRRQIDPDVRMDLSAADFFAGKDPVLDAAMAGISAP